MVNSKNYSSLVSEPPVEEVLKINLKSLEPYITCEICKGYLIDTTAVNTCMHRFCKTCIVKHLENKNTCPSCEKIIDKDNPLDHLRQDESYQNLVYKVVPNLKEDESERVRAFYAKQEEQACALPLPSSTDENISQVEGGDDLIP